MNPNKKLRLIEEAVKAAKEFEQQGKIQESVDEYLRAAELLKTLEGNEKQYALVLSDAAVGLTTLAQYTKAKHLLEKSLSILRNKLGNNHIEVVKRLNNLANVFSDLGEYEQAIELYQHILAIQEVQLGKQHADVAKSLNNLATVYTELGDYGQARELHQRALVIREKQLGRQHPEVAISLNNLATLYNRLGDYEQAKELFQRALTIQEKQLGELHPNTATSYDNLAIVYCQLGNYEQAIELHQRALVIREKQLGRQHPGVAKSLNNLASIYQQLGEYEQAKTLYERARSIVAKTLGEQHPLAKTISDNYFKLQNEVAELQQELIEAEKFKFLGQIMTQVAHNINNPLQVIHGNVTGALDDLNQGLFDATTELRPLLEKLQQQTNRISNLIQDFRKLAQGDRKKLETVNLNELAEQAAAYLREQFSIHKIQLIIELTQPAPLAHSNALVVTEAIVNLLSNAKDALSGQKAAKVILSTWEDAQYVGIKVEDNGKGIHPEQHPQLFRAPYPSQKTAGMGLGLYTSHHTLKSLGGKITYTPREPGGACFTITLKKANHV